MVGLRAITSSFTVRAAAGRDRLRWGFVTLVSAFIVGGGLVATLANVTLAPNRASSHES